MEVGCCWADRLECCWLLDAPCRGSNNNSTSHVNMKAGCQLIMTLINVPSTHLLTHLSTHLFLYLKKTASGLIAGQNAM